MKKIFLFLSALIVLNSCAEDVKFNNPSLQAMNGDVLFKAPTPLLSVNIDGTYTISGEYGFEIMDLKIPSLNAGTYKFGINNNTVAYYKYEADGLVLEYSTILGTSNPDMQPDLGEITIFPSNHPKASKEPGTISGEFKFNGKLLNENPFGPLNVFFQKGHFYGLKAQNFQDTGNGDDEDEDEEDDEEVTP